MEKNDIATIIDKLIIIPDTNILLYLYKCSFNTSQNIANLFEKVKERMLIPNRVHKEYLSHKDEEQAKIDKKYDTFTKALKKQVDELKDKIGGSISESRRYDFPNCDSLESNISLSLDNTVKSIIVYEYSLSAEKLNKSNQIANIERLVQFLVNEQKINSEPSITEILEYIKEGEFRYKYKMPPGYMDEEEKDKEIKKDNKKDNFEGKIRKYGDLFIWKEIINIGREDTNDSTLLFLTNDVKEDWWVLRGEQNNKETVRMRDELLKEYTSVTGKEKIEFMTLSKFYELFSNYYKICDIKTTLELDYQSYIQNLVNTKYNTEIEDIMLEGLQNIDFEDIDADFYDYEKTDINIDELIIDEVSLHYGDDGETALYDVKVSADTFPITIKRKINKELLWHAEIELRGKVLVQIQRDLINLEEDAMVTKSFLYEVISNREAWEIYLEEDANARAEADETLEDYYNH